MYVHRDTQPAFFSFFFYSEPFPVEKFPSWPQAAANGATRSRSRLIYFYTLKLYFIYIYICWLKNIRIIMEFWIQFFSILLHYGMLDSRKKLNNWEIFYYLIIYFLLVEKAIFLKRVCTFNGWLRGLIWIMNVRLHTLAWIKKIDGAYIS